MFLLEFGRVLKFAGQSFLRNFWLSVATITIVILALFSVSSVLIFNFMTGHVLSVVEAKTDVYIDLTGEASEEQAAVLVDELKKLSAVKEVEFINPEATLENFRQRHQDNPLIIQSLDALETNPFLGSLRLNVYKIEDFPVILAELSKKEYSQFLDIEDKEFTDSKILVQGISEYSAKIQRAGLFVSLLFVLISILVVFNTIQVGIYTHREEIGIMKLVGASNSFIRSPFLIEGIVYSFISIIILTAILFPVLAFLQPYVDGFFKEYSTNLVSLMTRNIFKVVGVQLLVAVVITVASSYIAVRKYLKV